MARSSSARRLEPVTEPAARARPSLVDTLTTRAPLITAALLVLLVAMSVVGALGPGDEAREDVARMSADVDAQRELILQQRELIQTQVELTRRLVAMQQDLLELARTGTATTVQIERRIAALGEVLRRVADDVEDINRKTGGDVPG